ncbi:acetyltransferase [Corynebacterium ulcerans]|uniref:GNAT family N-acetyltransferase n=1 Tax=Corynebacterium ulcerans TaxID=65058 RepID=UPI0006283B2E|nr:GNAT family N-acetyltransferase [Corynebacterium ulcerans]KKO85482.1 acetyltransferase [Corynebacterium ulcerans]KKO87699.1 acetyltransferase [Corynebacterium ulcerans]KPJ24503.1 acetyltransferase [Corynebacterium ulcerans]BDV25625.1 N-acetyltransferase [Corynebacterium ulcerans]
MHTKDFYIRPLRRTDFGQVQQIYLLGLNTGHASYEIEAPSWEKFSGTKIPETLFVAVDAEDDSKILGWVSAAPISSRSVFRGVVEDSIYIHPDTRGRGVAGALLDKLIDVCQGLGIWSIHSWIFPENEGSAGLHESRGFEKVGTLGHLAKMTYGEMAGQWRDTDIWEKLLPKPEIDDHTAAALDLS